MDRRSLDRGPRPRGPSTDFVSATLLKVAVALFAGWLLIELWPVVLLIVVALMVAGMLSPPIEWLEHRGVGRGRAIALVFSGLFAVVVATGALTVPNLSRQLSDVVEQLPHAQADLAGLLEHSRLTQPLAQSASCSEFSARCSRCRSQRGCG